MDSDGKNVLEGREGFAAHLPGLEEVTLPEGIKEIPPSTFLQCFSLKNVAIPESVQTIGYQAFSFDVSLDIDFTKLTNLTSIEWCAFSIINANGGNSVGGEDTYTDEITDNGGIKNISNTDETIKKINSYLDEVGYRTTGSCKGYEYGCNRNGQCSDSTSSNSNFSYCLTEVKADKNYKNAIQGEFIYVSYYKVKVFYQLDLPVLHQLFGFNIKGDTKPLYNISNAKD